MVERTQVCILGESLSQLKGLCKPILQDWKSPALCNGIHFLPQTRGPLHPENPSSAMPVPNILGGPGADSKPLDACALGRSQVMPGPLVLLFILVQGFSCFLTGGPGADWTGDAMDTCALWN